MGKVTGARSRRKRAHDPDELVRRYYRGYDEKGRLGHDPYRRLEFDTTLRYLRRFLPSGGRLLDAGGGPGRYTVALAKRGYRLSLIDLLPEHVETARRSVRAAGVERRVERLETGSLDDLSRFPDGTFDGVLCLGSALGHVVDRKRRARALRELVRVAKPGSPVFISVIGRLLLLSRSMLATPEEWEEDPEMYREIERTGNYDGRYGFAPCHFYLVEELQQEMREAGLRLEVTVGLEGLLPPYNKQVKIVARKYPRALQAWRAMTERTCEDPAVVRFSAHFLVVGRKARRRP